MLDEKYISKLINYYLNDDLFVDICHDYLEKKFNLFQLRPKIQKDFSDLDLILISEFCSFFCGIENHDFPIPKENINDKFYIGGMNARILKLKNDKMLSYLEYYKAPAIAVNRIKFISSFNVTDLSDNRATECQIEFINNIFPSISWRI